MPGGRQVGAGGAPLRRDRRSGIRLRQALEASHVGTVGRETVMSVAVACFAAAVVVALAAIDIRHRIIPNRIVLPATAIVLAIRVGFFPSDCLRFLAAAAVAGVALAIVSVVTRSGIGMGD